MLAGLVAALHAVAVAAAPYAGPALAVGTPVVGAAVVSYAVISQHRPEADPVPLRGAPEAALECMQRRIAAHPARLAAVVQPLYGSATYSVVLKRGGVTGEPVTTGVVQQTATGSSAEFRPLSADSLDADAIATITDGC